MTQTATTQKVRRYTTGCMMCGQALVADVPLSDIPADEEVGGYALTHDVGVALYCKLCDCFTDATDYTMEEV